MTSKPATRTRRAFLRESGSCLAHVLGPQAVAPWFATRAFAAERGHTVAREPWGRIERVSDGIWALISTPLEDRTTLCNGGIVRGRTGVLVIESFARPEGASWLAEQARELTGRRPDHVVLTHYHSDHTAGIAGYAGAAASPQLHMTERTRELVRQADARRTETAAPARIAMLDRARAIDPTRPGTLDLGDVRVTIAPHDGHTASDVSIEIADPPVVFCGDLVWNRMFPNYVDAVPSRLSRSVRALLRYPSTTYVPGHGPLADDPELRGYIELLDDVEAAARRAHERGMDAAAAATEYRLPAAMAAWTLFSPRYFETAIGAWLKELRPGKPGVDGSMPSD
ncbi:MAG: MBL fold metallo-hydrolase [Gemmatimonadetes bacterium]|nr:MBL fold metallo-hydrolase [Gemmatimonadota bacterium]